MGYWTPFLLICSLAGQIRHDTKLSLCTIEFDESSTSALINFRLFTDDLAQVVDAPLLKNLSDKQYDQKIVEYLNQHFSIHINQAPQLLLFFTRSANEEVFEISFLISNLEPIEEVSIHNSIFLETFEKQKNLVKLKKGKEEKHIFFEKNKQSIKLGEENLFK